MLVAWKAGCTNCYRTSRLLRNNGSSTRRTPRRPSTTRRRDASKPRKTTTRRSRPQLLHRKMPGSKSVPSWVLQPQDAGSPDRGRRVGPHACRLRGEAEGQYEWSAGEGTPRAQAATSSSCHARPSDHGAWMSAALWHWSSSGGACGLRAAWEWFAGFVGAGPDQAWDGGTLCGTSAVLAHAWLDVLEEDHERVSQHQSWTLRDLEFECTESGSEQGLDALWSRPATGVRDHQRRPEQTGTHRADTCRSRRGAERRTEARRSGRTQGRQVSCPESLPLSRERYSDGPCSGGPEGPVAYRVQMASVRLFSEQFAVPGCSRQRGCLYSTAVVRDVQVSTWCTVLSHSFGLLRGFCFYGMPVSPFGFPCWDVWMHCPPRLCCHDFVLDPS